MALFAPSRMLHAVRRLVRNDQLVLSVLALVVGTIAGLAVIGFREAIVVVQTFNFGSGAERLYHHVARLPGWLIVAVPTTGGLAVGLILKFIMPGGRPLGVADVIEASALKGGRMSLNQGFGAAIVSALSIGSGASVGREGPAVHLGASLGGWIARRLHLTRTQARTLLGCGVAAAVAGSFNAPIAGALFANEVVIGHYALSAFAPTVIASVTGTALSRWWFGDFPAFVIGEHVIHSMWEFPAFVGLGILCGLMAKVLLSGIVVVDEQSRRLPVPDWFRPALGGLLVGLIALVYPHVLGVGYGVTETALTAGFALGAFVAVMLAKLAATCLSLGFGFGGGIFSPALVIGALLGGTYGSIATQTLPQLSSGVTAYSILGMGAVAAAVLGAPISTALIVFEMTGDYALTMALMMTVVVATVVTNQLGVASFFAQQLERRGLDLKGGFETQLLRATSVGRVMEKDCVTVTPDVGLPALRPQLQESAFGELFVVTKSNVLIGTITLADLSETAFDQELDDLLNAADVARLHPPVLCIDDTLEEALNTVRDSGEAHIAVVEDRENLVFCGCVHERDVMAAYNRTLVEVRHEERGA